MGINGSVNEPHFSVNEPHFKTGAAARSNGPDRKSGNTHGGAPHFLTKRTPTSDHISAPDLEKLQEQFGELESVRQDRVRLLKEKVASGFYSTTEAAEQTASAILSKASQGARKA